MRFNEPNIQQVDTPAGEIMPEATKGGAFEIKGYASYSTAGGNAAGLTSQRSPQQNAQAQMIMDSTSQKKQGGEGFLPRINSSENDFVQKHDIEGNAFDYGIGI